MALFAAGALLLWPIAPDTPLWDMPGAFGGGVPGSYGEKIVTPIGALFSGAPLGDGGNRLQLAAGLVLLGVAVASFVAVGAWARAPKGPDAPRVESHGFIQA